ncbi:hypothetical protein Taro_025102 [Colocasia esculenta]|uniref:Uncharacterized protein n=1 Tax=Colocasia esculenta TaxID=4460 RepID=A0A843VMD3_COLES|nr:hypothetical protein [Colocasia esculenta]
MKGRSVTTRRAPTDLFNGSIQIAHIKDEALLKNKKRAFLNIFEGVYIQVRNLNAIYTQSKREELEPKNLQKLFEAEVFIAFKPSSLPFSPCAHCNLGGESVTVRFQRNLFTPPLG